MLHKLSPKNLTSQLMLVLTVVIAVAQLINLTLLMDANRLQARSNIVAGALTSLVQHVERLNENRRFRPPLNPRTEGSLFLITKKFNHTLFNSKFVTTNFDDLITSTLSGNGITRESHTLLIGAREQLGGDDLLFSLSADFNAISSNPCIACLLYTSPSPRDRG